MPSPKSGNPGMPVTPSAPDAPDDADDAVAGAMSDPKSSSNQIDKQKPGKQKVKPFKPPSDEEKDDEDKQGWIEIELVDEEDKPVAGEPYEIELPDGTVASGSTDDKGFARVEGFPSGQCKVTFPQLDKDAWEPR